MPGRPWIQGLFLKSISLVENVMGSPSIVFSLDSTAVVAEKNEAGPPNQPNVVFFFLFTRCRCLLRIEMVKVVFETVTIWRM